MLMVPKIAATEIVVAETAFFKRMMQLLLTLTASPSDPSLTRNGFSNYKIPFNDIN